ncbi:MAG: hypothetical protein O7B25_08940 [Gammaproteobacteria bacterium]|nr:hypothetical protein [Gammaproteobacteria bacterium]
MTLMKLAPEIVRLRRVAKAYAAGEFSRVEYREARRDVIENFQPDVIGDDDTQPRFVPVGQERSRRRADSSGPRWRWLVGICAVALALAFIGQVQAATRIGKVSERNPNPLTSPRIAVSSVQIRDFKAYPGIAEQQVQATIESALLDIRGRNSEGTHGFTGAELEEVARFLNALGVHRSDSSMTAGQTADLGQLIRDQKARRGVSVVELEEIASRVQEHYRDAGYFLSVAFLPAQEPKDGVVELSVLPGVLGDVVVTGGDADLVASQFSDVLGQPVTEDGIARRLYRLNRLPGLKTQAAFEPGIETGETRLNLDIIEQRSWAAAIVADNHGDDTTGKQRLTLLGSWLNPRGTGDVLDIGVLQTVDPSNQTYGFVEYQTPLGGVHEIRARVANNSFTAGDGAQVDGDGLMFDLVARRLMRRSRSRSLTAEVGLHHHRFSWRENEDQAATFVSGLMHADKIWDGKRIAAGVSVSADIGRFSTGAFAGQEEFFWRIGADAYAWRPIHIPALRGEQKLAVRFTGQFSDSQLPSSRRLSLGGFSRTRGFERDTFLADRGVVIGLDLRVPLPLGELVVFVDSAYGEGRNELTPSWGHLTNVGLGWDADLLPNLVSRISLAFPVGATGSAKLDEHGSQLYWQLQYAY